MAPFLLVNAGSGGGHAQDGVLAAADDLGLARHVVQPGDDFAQVLERAVADGADLVAAAGGDGTLCAAANVAMTHDLPLLVVPAGTRNHFALDLGLDLQDPAGVLRAGITGGFERRVDVGTVNGTTFLNNVSLGIYAAAVGSEGYREHKVRALVTAASQAVDHDQGRTAHLTIVMPQSSVDRTVEGSGAVLVVNNAYSPTFSPGSRLRSRLDAGLVWVYVGGGLDAEQTGMTAVLHAVGAALSQQLLRAAHGAPELVIESDRPDVPVAVDGEVRPDLVAPLRFASRPGALRVRVPADPGPAPVDVVLMW